MNWLDTLKAIAPTVATAIAGPLGGAAVVAIGSVLGMTEPTQEAIAKVFTDGQLSSADLVKIRQLETEYKTHESEMGFKYADLEYKKDELVAKDRADARNMQIAVHSKMPAVLTIMVTIGFFGVLTALLMMPELKANELSMALCHYRKQGYLTRELVDSDKKLGRKQVWTYTYHSTKQPKETV